MSSFLGTIIKESLSNPVILSEVKILETQTEVVTPNHHTPWLKYWTTSVVDVPSSEIKDFCERLSQEFETEHACWYADFKNDSVHYIVFPGKVFCVDRSKSEQYEEVRSYGTKWGIPEKQLDFSP